ncbi:type I restriction-modification system specificity subunit [Parvularcula bermudensis HTCC2503]|uniref:Type I restriction-modification system specificity subunit n=1 Tax=Parvularcula bermudensis (strain ATCC BAA-594 / HTCC2503 / KCTC 12087) TaxID=314260 RepID=E0TGZ6_PARBH|nr:restriction endonuclease subunit S [Parvularcula bermudensis]ADM09236.1 type I restriction-modification system specificity subunit [Parvularcula bermudensis HTCC2503]
MVPEGWKMESLGNWIEAYREKSVEKDQYPVLTSSREGLIPQSEYYGESRITSRDNVGFHVIPPQFFTYRSRSDDGLFFFNRNDTGQTGIISHFYPVFDFPKGNSDFFLAALNFWRKRFAGYAVGSSQVVLSLNALKSVKLPIPPKHVQDEIADILTSWDRAIKTTEKLIANSQAQKKSLMQQLLTGKKRLPRFSDVWREVQLGELGDFIKGKGIPRDEVVETGLPAIRYGEIYTTHHFIVETFASFISEEAAAQSVPLNNGDILFTCSGETADEIGKCVAYLGNDRSFAGGDIILFREHGQCAHFLGYALNSSEVVRQKTRFGQGNSVVHINARNLSQITLMLPSLEEQEAIADILDTARRDIRQLEIELQNLQIERAALMQQLLTGKRRVKVEKEAAA